MVNQRRDRRTVEQLTDQELQKLPFEEQLEYLDRLSEYLRSIPLPPSKRDMGIVKIMSEKGYLSKEKLEDKK